MFVDYNGMIGNLSDYDPNPNARFEFLLVYDELQ